MTDVEDGPAPSTTAHAASAGWTVVVEPQGAQRHRLPSGQRLVARAAAAAGAVLLAVGIGGSLAARRLAEAEAVHDAAVIADVLAETGIQPYVNDGLVRSDPAAVAALHGFVTDHVLDDQIVRVKLWTPDGRVVYADEPHLIGSTFALEDEQLDVLAHPATRAEVSDLSKPENRFEDGDRMLEVYRPVWTPSGDELLFEIYLSYEPVRAQAVHLWRGFSGIAASSLLLIAVLIGPVVAHLWRRLREGHRLREQWLQRAVDASSLERRRIAGTLHDGPVQELAGAALSLSAAAARLTDGDGQPSRALELGARQVRATIGSLRTLLVDIYPPTLADAGLHAALADLGESLVSRDVQLSVEVHPHAVAVLDDSASKLIYRTAQECLRNSATHAAPCLATVQVRLDGATGLIVMEVGDDGPGFDYRAVTANRAPGHVGLSVLADLAADAGAGLAVRSTPQGTCWRLTIGDR